MVTPDTLEAVKCDHSVTWRFQAMPRVSAQEAADRMVAGVNQAGPRYSSGVQNSKDWAAAYVAAEPVMNAGIQQALADGRFTRGVTNLGTAGWRQRTIAKGPANWINGVNQSKPRIVTGMNTLYGMLDTAAAAIANTPRGDYNANRARATAHMDAMHAAALQRKAGG